MNHSQRFLILTSDTGFGHRSAANAVATALQRLHPETADVSIVNPISRQSPLSILKKTEMDYDRNVTFNQDWYRFSYEISNSRPASLLVETTLTFALFQSLKELIDDFQPDAILNTHEMFTAPTAAVLSQKKHHIPFHTVITDLSDVHSLWFNSVPDQFYVASTDIQDKAIASGLPAEKIRLTGIPINPRFADPQPDKASLRAFLGLRADMPTLLAVGSRRVNGLPAYLMALDAASYPFQIAVITGGDDDLYAEIMVKKWSHPIRLENMVTNMPEWMADSDVLVSKAGGLIISEGLAAGLPIILIGSLPGQEAGNVRFVLDQQAGCIVENPQELPGLVDELFTDRSGDLASMSACSRKIGRADAALQVASALWDAVHS
jgi:1,2-diacylglycerol 3-beta-galactosyltransferase